MFCYHLPFLPIWSSWIQKITITSEKCLQIGHNSYVINSVLKCSFEKCKAFGDKKHQKLNKIKKSLAKTELGAFYHQGKIIIVNPASKNYFQYHNELFHAK